MFGNTFNSNLALVPILILFISLGKANGVSVSCGLKWVSEGYGNIPAWSIASGSNEYVGRAYHDEKWIPGRVSPVKGKIFIASDSSSFEYDTYEVLTNPDKCLLEWADGYAGSYPSNAVSPDRLVDPSEPEILVGRGVVAGLTLGGQVIVDESAVFISYDGHSELRRSYQVLRSFYPPLKVTMSSFQFFPTELKDKNTTELIGLDDIRHSFNAESAHSIDHGKIIHERFTLSEEKDWSGFALVHFRFPLWFGSSDVSGTFELDPDDPQTTELTIYREREIRIKRDLAVKAASGTSSSHIQVCSTVSIIENLDAPIQFTADAVYEAENMSANQVKIILEALIRPVSDLKTHQRNAVKGSIAGTLNGRFAVHSSSYVSSVDSAGGVCSGYATPSIKKY